jgi:RNA polymerase sigma factor (sigma-70 family)
VGRSLLESVLRKVGPLAVDGRVGDAELLRRFTADRDETAFAALVRRHGPLVWAVCRQLLPHEPDAEDAFQATFLALVRGADRVRTPAALGAWLHSTAYRVAQQAKRSAARQRQRDHVAAAPEAAAPVADSAWDRVQSAVHEEVGRLPEPLRTAFVLCDLQGVRQPEAAAALGWRPARSPAG